MPNTSATGGYLAPTSAPPLEDDALDDFFQALVVGITGLSGTLVFPRYQAEAPTLPPYGTTWGAVGVVHRVPDTFAAVVHNGTGQGKDTVEQHEVLDVLCTFYGPASGATARLLRQGLAVAQNREPLFLAGMGLNSVSDHRRAPELIKEQWLNRYDVNVLVKRRVDGDYTVLNLLKAVATMNAQAGNRAPIVAPIATPPLP